MENNVFVENTTGILIVEQTDREATVRNCVLCNCGRATSPTSFCGLSKRVANGNCVWAYPWQAGPRLDEQLRYFDDHSKSNFIADPLFAAPIDGDCRLTPGSPCRERGRGGVPVGLMEVAPRKDARDRTPPALNLTKQPALGAMNAHGDATVYVSQTASFPIHMEAYDGEAH